MTPAKRLLGFALVSSLLASGCAIFDPHDGDTNVYEGSYSWGFEVNGFKSCDGDGPWWVIAADDNSGIIDSLVSRYYRIADTSYEEVYARLRGHPGPKGTYGHVGAYTREFYLDDIIEMRKATPGDCD